MSEHLKTIVLGLWLLALAPAQAQEDESPPPAQSAEGESAGAAMASEADERAAEDAAVEDVLSEAELIYRDEGDDKGFIPSEQVSADQSLDYPIDI